MNTRVDRALIANLSKAPATFVHSPAAGMPALPDNLSSSTVTITIASPGVITWNANGLVDGDSIVLSTTGALPTGLTAGTTYYAINSTTNTFQLAATPGGTPINTSGAQSGVHTAKHILSAAQQAQFNQWLSKNNTGASSSQDEMAAFDPYVQTMIANYRAFFQSAAWVAWAQSDADQREMQYRVRQVAIAEAVVRAATLPISSDPAGAGTPGPSVRDINTPVPAVTVTLSITSPCVVTWANHLMAVGRPFVLTTSGALPTGVTAGKVYYVLTILDANTFTFSDSINGSAINSSGTQSGTQTLTIVNDYPELQGGQQTIDGTQFRLWGVPIGRTLNITDIILTAEMKTLGFFCVFHLQIFSDPTALLSLWHKELFAFRLPETVGSYNWHFHLNSALVVPGGTYLWYQGTSQSGPVTTNQGYGFCLAYHVD